MLHGNTFNMGTTTTHHLQSGALACVSHSQDNRAHAGWNGGCEVSVQATENEHGRVESHHRHRPVGLHPAARGQDMAQRSFMQPGLGFITAAHVLPQ